MRDLKHVFFLLLLRIEVNLIILEGRGMKLRVRREQESMCVSLILFSPWKQSLSISNPKPMEFTAAEGKFHYHNNTHGIPMTTHLNSNWYTLVKSQT